METIIQRFERVKEEGRDISEHMDVLYKYASECSVIVELGVNEGISTTAFCLAVHDNHSKEFFNYDVHITTMFQELIDICKLENITMNFTMEDDRNIIIPECDLLFIDTLHIYEQLKTELELHANKSRKYIILHDTETFGAVGEGGKTKGLWPALSEFIEDNNCWKIKEHYPNNNGLTIIERNDNL